MPDILKPRLEWERPDGPADEFTARQEAYNLLSRNGHQPTADEIEQTTAKIRQVRAEKEKQEDIIYTEDCIRALKNHRKELGETS